jgi:hypothetical protein
MYGAGYLPSYSLVGVVTFLSLVAARRLLPLAYIPHPFLLYLRLFLFVSRRPERPLLASGRLLERLACLLLLL